MKENGTGGGNADMMLEDLDDGLKSSVQANQVKPTSNTSGRELQKLMS